MIISKTAIETAVERIRPYLSQTPLIYSPYYSDKTDCNVFLKLETVQPTHSFKVRGAFNAILSLPEEKRRVGIVTASGGNHGLGVALACTTLDIPCTIYLPVGTQTNKVEKIKHLGARVTLHGEAWDEANKLALDTAEREGRTYVHPFDNRNVMAGQGTIVTELAGQLDKVDMIVASIGGGGLISGIISAVEHFLPGTRVAGVETEGANCMSESLNAGKIIELPAITSICETLGARKTEQTHFEIVSKYASGVSVVSDEEAKASLIDLLSEEKLLVEPATSCSLAALTSRKISFEKGETIVVIMCGGNVALEDVCRWKLEAVPAP